MTAPAPPAPLAATLPVSLASAAQSLREGGADRRMVGLLTAMTALGSLSVSVYVPSLPAIATGFGVAPGEVKLTLTAFLAAFALAQLVYAPLSERFGRRPVVLAGLGLYVLGSLACAAATGLQALLWARVAQALGASVGPALGRAIVRDLVTPAQLAGVLATMSAVISLSPMVGPTVGGLLQSSWGWRSGFVLLGVLGALVAALAWHCLPETRPEPDLRALRPAVVAGRYGQLLADPALALCLLHGGLMTAAAFAWTAGAPFLFINVYHLRPDHYGWVALIVGAGLLVGTSAVKRLGTRLQTRTLVLLGSGLALAGAVALGAAATLGDAALALVAAMWVYTLGFGMASPGSTALALQRFPALGSVASALIGASAIAIGALGTAAASAIDVQRPTQLAGLVLAAAALSAVAALGVWWQTRPAALQRAA